MSGNRDGGDSFQHLSEISRTLFGKRSYQGSDDFLKWAPREGHLKILMASTQSGVGLSIIHSMRVETEFGHFVSFFNFVTDAKNSGQGVSHLARVRREKNFLIPAVADRNLWETYARLGAQEIRFDWFRRWLMPRPNAFLIRRALAKKEISINDKKNRIFLTNKLTDERLARISELSMIPNVEFIKWRLSSKNDDRVFVFETSDSHALVIGVFGRRKCVPVIRVICCFGPPTSVKALVDRACHLGRSLGATVCLLTVQPEHSDAFSRDSRYKLRHGIKTFFKQVDTGTRAFTGKWDGFMLCGDLGLNEQFGG